MVYQKVLNTHEWHVCQPSSLLIMLTCLLYIKESKHSNVKFTLRKVEIMVPLLHDNPFFSNQRCNVNVTQCQFEITWEQKPQTLPAFNSESPFWLKNFTTPINIHLQIERISSIHLTSIGNIILFCIFNSLVFYGESTLSELLLIQALHSFFITHDIHLQMSQERKQIKSKFSLCICNNFSKEVQSKMIWLLIWWGSIVLRLLQKQNESHRKRIMYALHHRYIMKSYFVHWTLQIS